MLAYNLEYYSLNDDDIFRLLNAQYSTRKYYGELYYQWNYAYESVFNNLIKEYGYTAKSLLLYIDYLKTYEALEDVEYAIKELRDYASMMKRISPKFDKYPRHFLTTHKIASRNYNRLKEQFREENFKKRINKDMERTFGEYRFIYPNTTQDIKDEAVQQNNCVASYIQSVIDGNCHILFLRKKDNLDKSLVTIEVRNNKIVQALQRFNHPLTTEQQEVVDRWNSWYANKIKKKDGDENCQDL